MPVTKQHTLEDRGHARGAYGERFERLLDAERTNQVDQMGYDILQLITFITSLPGAGGRQPLAR